MDGADLLVSLGARGIELRLNGNRLVYGPKDALTAEIRAELEAHKTGIRAALRELAAEPQSLLDRYDRLEATGISPRLAPGGPTIWRRRQLHAWLVSVGGARPDLRDEVSSQLHWYERMLPL